MRYFLPALALTLAACTSAPLLHGDGIADKLHAINAQGAKIARHAARENAYVAGAIGPLGIRIEPWGKTGVDEAEGFFREQAEALAEGGVDLFVLETFRDLNEIGAAIAAVRSVRLTASCDCATRMTSESSTLPTPLPCTLS